jgi:hypothetical protein
VSGGGALRLTGSTVTGSLGRAVLAFGPIAVTSSTFTNNNGGSALEGLGLTIDVVDSTFTDNGQATGGDGGGAIAAPQGNLTLRHVTFSGNAVPADGDGADVSVAETLTVRSTAFTGGGSGEPCEVTGATISEGYSYEQGSTTCGLDDPDDLASEESAFLEPQADNGGPTLTMLPGFNSPLVDSAPASACADPLDVDQAGAARPVDGDFDGVAECDTGAVERPRLQLFTDVPPGHQFFNDISWMAWNLISTGFQPGPAYRPDQVVTRRAMSSFLYRLADPSGFTPPATPTFSDVPHTNPFFTEIEWMADEGITNGFPGGLYKPGQAVSRQAMSAFMFRLDPLIP